jgi:hypothetical protein
LTFFLGLAALDTIGNVFGKKSSAPVVVNTPASATFIPPSVPAMATTTSSPAAPVTAALKQITAGLPSAPYGVGVYAGLVR